MTCKNGALVVFLAVACCFIPEAAMSVGQRCTSDAQCRSEYYTNGSVERCDAKSKKCIRIICGRRQGTKPAKVWDNCGWDADCRQFKGSERMRCVYKVDPRKNSCRVNSDCGRGDYRRGGAFHECNKTTKKCGDVICGAIRSNGLARIWNNCGANGECKRIRGTNRMHCIWTVDPSNPNQSTGQPVECSNNRGCPLGQTCAEGKCVTDVAADRDRDGVPDNVDSCPAKPNAAQLDTDRDKIGDACDPDIDNDGRRNDGDNCRYAPNPQQRDLDRDGKGDACDADTDGDGILNTSDRCPFERGTDTGRIGCR